MYILVQSAQKYTVMTYLTMLYHVSITCTHVYAQEQDQFVIYLLRLYSTSVEGL